MIFDLVYNRLSEKESEKLYQIWRENNQIHEDFLDEDPKQYMLRVSQWIFYLVKDYEGNILGSAGIYHKKDGVYFRTFILPSARTSAVLGTLLMLKTRDAIKEFNLSNGRPFKVELQNKRLEGPGMTNEFQKNGFVNEGRNEDGLLVWSYSLED